MSASIAPGGTRRIGQVLVAGSAFVTQPTASFHHLTRDSTQAWGKVPWPCSCVTSHGHCACKHAALLTSVFDATIKVPKDYVAAEPSLRKKSQKLRDVADPKRARHLAERRKETAK